jgi:hypothetical protein
LTLFGAVTNVLKQVSAFFFGVDMSNVRRVEGNIPRGVDSTLLEKTLM